MSFVPYDSSPGFLAGFRALAAALAHDLSGQLEIARDACERMLVDGEGEGDGDGDGEAAGELSGRLKDIADYVRDLGRLGAEVMDERHLSVRQLAERVVERLEGQPRWSGVSFEVCGRDSFIAGDARLIALALGELVEVSASRYLARRATGGGVRVTIADGELSGEIAVDIFDHGSDVEGPCVTRDRTVPLTLADAVIRSHRGILFIDRRQNVGHGFRISLQRAV